jgi:hypothetical protein
MQLISRCINSVFFFLHSYIKLYMSQEKGKAISVTGHGSPLGCETSRFPHFLHNQLTYGSEVVSLMRRLPFTPNDLIRNRTHDLPPCSVVPQPTTLSLAPRICHINSKACVQYNWSLHIRKSKKIQWLYIRLFKNTFIYMVCTSILSPYGIYTNFKGMKHFLGREWNECVFRYLLSTIKNRAFSYIRLLETTWQITANF